MKIRNGFVSNSSASSYLVRIQNDTDVPLSVEQLWKENETEILNKLVFDCLEDYEVKTSLNSNELFPGEHANFRIDIEQEIIVESLNFEKFFQNSEIMTLYEGGM